MKKLLNVILSLLLFLTFVGCEKKQDDISNKTERIVVFAKDETNSGLVLFADGEGKTIETKEISYPYALYYDDDSGYLFYSEDGAIFSSIGYQKHKSGDKLSDIEGVILALNDSSYVSYISGGVCKIGYDGSETCLSVYMVVSIKGEEYFYFVDDENYLYACSLKDFSVVNKTRLIDSEFLALTKIDGKVYIVNDDGLTLIEGDRPATTYVYPNTFNEIDNVIGKYLVVNEKDETVVYQMSFDAHRLILTTVLDEIFYRNIDFEKEYADLYAEGYYVRDYYVIGG